jgi:hypothetical protein
MKSIHLSLSFIFIGCSAMFAYPGSSAAEEKKLPETVPLENSNEPEAAAQSRPLVQSRPAPIPTAPAGPRVSAREQRQVARMELRAERREDRRTALVFGLSVAGSAICVLPTLLLTGVFGSFSDLSVELGYGIAMGLSPLSSSLLASLTARNSPDYNVPLGTMILSGYVGSAASYVALFFFMEKDDPKVDGKYDAIYFDNNEAADIVLGILTLGLVPLLIPAVCVTMGYHWGRKRNPRVPNLKEIAFTPPSPIIMRGPGTGQRAFGARLVGGTF